MFGILLCPKTSKNDLFQKELIRLLVPMSSSQHAVSLLKNQNYPFIPGIALLFFRSVLLFFKSALSFPGSAYFSKMSYCFPELPFSFHKCLLFIYCALVFPGILFSPSWLHFFLILFRELLKDISLAFVLFPLAALYWQTYDVF